MLKSIKSFGTISAVLTIAACGGLVERGLPPPPADAGSLFDVSPEAAPHSFLQPLAVTGGWVVEAIFYLDNNTKQILPEQACQLGGRKTFWTSPYQLMKFEVTRAQYQQCVDAGACLPADGPLEPTANGVGTEDLPVTVSFGLARAFCQQYGGDLPTYAQWDRAAAGDTLGALGVASLTAAWLACHYGGAGPICDELASAVPRPVPGGRSLSLSAVGAQAWDRGPYGHADLHGNAEEWVRTPALNRVHDFCALSDYGPDPATFTREEPGQAEIRQTAELLDDPRTNEGLGVPDGYPGHAWLLWGGRNWNQPSSYTGFRCAFPLAQ
jgi:formylglycine-generating enzyme required for sulfatase activity